MGGFHCEGGVPFWGGPLRVTVGEEQIGDPPRDGETSPRIRALQFALHHLHLQQDVVQPPQEFLLLFLTRWGGVGGQRGGVTHALCGAQQRLPMQPREEPRHEGRVERHRANPHLRGPDMERKTGAGLHAADVRGEEVVCEELHGGGRRGAGRWPHRENGGGL